MIKLLPSCKLRNNTPLDFWRVLIRFLKLTSSSVIFVSQCAILVGKHMKHHLCFLFFFIVWDKVSFCSVRKLIHCLDWRHASFLCLCISLFSYFGFIHLFKFVFYYWVYGVCACVCACMSLCVWCAHAVVHMWRPENNFRELLTSFLHRGTQGWNSSCRVCMATSLCFDPPHQHYFCSWRQGLIAPVALHSPYSRRWLWSPDLLPPKCWSHRHGPPCQFVPFTAHNVSRVSNISREKNHRHSCQGLSNLRCTKAKKSPRKFGSVFLPSW